MQMGERWRVTRKTLHQLFMESKCENEHISLQNAEAIQMLRDICNTPKDLMLHPKRYSNSIIASLRKSCFTPIHDEQTKTYGNIVYGIRTPSVGSRHMKVLYEIMEMFSSIMEVGATPPVDILPILKYMPERFWKNWQTRAKKVGEAMGALYEKMVQRVLERRERIGNKNSMLDTVLDQQDKLQLSPNELRFFCGAPMEGGSDTSASMILVFITAMLKYPDIQKKAQREIDAVVNEDRTPLWSDFDKLPYVNMVVKECMRWRPVTPLAFPHSTAEGKSPPIPLILKTNSATDDVVEGMFIPKGTTVILNVWGIHMDPIRFPSPDTFNPENYRGKTLLAAEYAASNDFENRDHYGYGAGRRICSGIHLAERGLWQAMAKLLWAFNFNEIAGKPVDISKETGYTEGFLHCPLDFECDVQVRSAKRKETIMREFAVAEKEVFSKYEV